MQFSAPVIKSKLYEVVADKIEQEILRDPSRVGLRLPSEQELAEGFEVSRTVIREAVKLLAERRLVTVKNGDGVYVEKPSYDALAQVLRRIVLMDEIDAQNIYDLRMILEPAACRMAAEQCKGHPEKLKHLDELYEDTVNCRSDKARRLRNDLEFHVEIARLSGNPVLECFVNAVRQMILLLMEKSVQTPDGSCMGVEYHGELLNILHRGDGERAYLTMLSHLKNCTRVCGLGCRSGI